MDVIRIFITITLLAIVSCVGAQNVGVEAPAKVQAGESFELSYIVKDVEPDNVQLPDFAPFRVLGGPNRSSQMTVINGKHSSDLMIGVYLMMDKPGTYNLPSAKFIFGQKVITTPARTIIIEPASKTDNANYGKSIYIKATIEPSNELYLGQQGILSYEILFNKDINVGNTISRPNLGDFNEKSLQMRSYNNLGKTKTINGQLYNYANLEASALFPNRSGTFTIDPLRKAVGVSDGTSNDDFGGFLGMKNYRPVEVASNALTVTVKPLPSPAPTTFTNAVGVYSLKAEVVNEGNGYKLYLAVTGDGDPKSLLVPKIKSTVDIEVYDGAKIEEQSDFDGQKQVHNTAYTYAIVPKRKAQLILPVSYTYFDVNKGEYHTISDSIAFDATKSDITSVDEEAVDLESSTDYYKILFGVLGALFFSSLGYLLIKFLLNRGRKLNGDGYQRPANITPSTKSVMATNKPNSYNTNTAYNAKNYVLSHISDKYKLAPKDLNRSDITNYLQKVGKPELAKITDQILEQCELSIYGGKSDDAISTDLQLLLSQFNDTINKK